VVDIVIRLRGGNRDNIVSTLCSSKGFSLPQSMQSGTVAQQSRTRGVPEAFSRGIMGSGRKSNHLRVHLWSYNLTPKNNRGVHDGNCSFHLTFNDPCR
jgi:hypothetical protein